MHPQSPFPMVPNFTTYVQCKSTDLIIWEQYLVHIDLIWDDLLVVTPRLFIFTTDPQTLSCANKTSKYKVAGSGVFTYHYTNMAKIL